jgi:hypothetical protein
MGSMKGLEPVHMHEAVVLGAEFFARSVGGVHHALDVRSTEVTGPARVQGDVVFLVPVPVVEDDLVQRLLTGQHGRQQDAVVVGVRLGTEDGDVVQVGCDLEQLFQCAHTCHAVADHHQFRFFHRTVLYRVCTILGIVAQCKGCTQALILLTLGAWHLK